MAGEELPGVVTGSARAATATVTGQEGAPTPPPGLGYGSLTSLQGLLQTFTGGDTGPNVVDWVTAFEEVASLGAWGDSAKLKIARLRCAGEALAFVRHDYKAKAATTWLGLKEALLARYNRDPMEAKIQRFLGAKQLPGESVSQFSSRLQALAEETVLPVDGETEEERRIQSRLGRTMLQRQIMSVFLKGLVTPLDSGRGRRYNSFGNGNRGLCYVCHQPGHYKIDCPQGSRPFRRAHLEYQDDTWPRRNERYERYGRGRLWQESDQLKNEAGYPRNDREIERPNERDRRASGPTNIGCRPGLREEMPEDQRGAAFGDFQPQSTTLHENQKNA